MGVSKFQSPYISAATPTSLNGVLAGDGSNLSVKPVDAIPADGSTNLITSDAVYDALQTAKAYTDSKLVGATQLWTGDARITTIQLSQNASNFRFLAIKGYLAYTGSPAETHNRGVTVATVLCDGRYFAFGSATERAADLYLSASGKNLTIGEYISSSWFEVHVTAVYGLN